MSNWISRTTKALNVRRRESVVFACKPHRVDGIIRHGNSNQTCANARRTVERTRAHWQGTRSRPNTRLAGPQGYRGIYRAPPGGQAPSQARGAVARKAHAVARQAHVVALLQVFAVLRRSRLG